MKSYIVLTDLDGPALEYDTQAAAEDAVRNMIRQSDADLGNVKDMVGFDNAEARIDEAWIFQLVKRGRRELRVEFDAGLEERPYTARFSNGSSMAVDPNVRGGRGTTPTLVEEV